MASRNEKDRCIVRCRHIYIRLFRFVRVHAFDGQTDRQTPTEIARSNRVRWALKISKSSARRLSQPQCPNGGSPTLASMTAGLRHTEIEDGLHVHANTHYQTLCDNLLTCVSCKPSGPRRVLITVLLLAALGGTLLLPQTRSCRLEQLCHFILPAAALVHVRSAT